MNGLQYIPLNVRIRKPQPTPDQLLDKCIDHLIQINTVIKEVLANVDQLDRDRMVYFMVEAKRMGKMILGQPESGTT